MNQSILKYLRKYSYHEQDINRLLVSSFLNINNIDRVHNKFIADLIINDQNSEEYKQFQNFIPLFSSQFNIEMLLELFEFVISPADKEVNGAVYTPKYIRDFIVSQSISQFEKQGKDLHTVKWGDIACGCGGFYITIVDELRLRTNKSYFEIYNNNIYGVDIQQYSISRTKILLSLYAIVNGEDCEEFRFNLYQGNSLSFNWNEVYEIFSNGGFDIIVGNPPYVGATKIDEETRLLLKNWSVTTSGKSDLYIPFFQIALKSLNKSGILGYITVSTFQKSLNARALRNYFSSNKYDMTLIDFGGEQVFKNRSTYTCICIIDKTPTNQIKYIKYNSKKINGIKRDDFVENSYNNLDDFEGWYLVDKITKSIIDKIENIGESLGNKFEIRNGFATLKNKVYVFRPISEDEKFYYLDHNNNIYKIERDICRDVIKPNTLKHESEIKNSIEKLIFPYVINKDNPDIFGNEKINLKILDERVFKGDFPNAYQYLLKQKDDLSKRDKGNREYEKWYAFGRNQALIVSGYKLFLPYITDIPCFVFSEDKDLLFYNGYAIISNSIHELLVLQKILLSKIFWYYIKNTSRPYSGKYFSVAKNYIKKFGICSLDENEQLALLAMDSKVSIDKFLCSKYNIDYKLI